MREKPAERGGRGGPKGNSVKAGERLVNGR